MNTSFHPQELLLLGNIEDELQLPSIAHGSTTTGLSQKLDTDFVGCLYYVLFFLTKLAKNTPFLPRQSLIWEVSCFEVSEVDIILAGHDHHYDVKPVGPHGTYACSSRLIFGSPTQVVGGSTCMKASIYIAWIYMFFSTILLTPQKEAKIGRNTG